MHHEHPADRLEDEALLDGTLDTGINHGMPLPIMDHDPLWWVKGLMNREAMAERLDEVTQFVDDVMEKAVNEPDLRTARDLLAKRNEIVVAWNADAQDVHALTVIEETDLLSRRTEASGG